MASEQEVLAKLAKDFNDYRSYVKEARLLVVAHADVRGSETYNQALSERRAALIRDYLVSKGIPSDKIQIRAVGKDQQLDEKQVEALQRRDPEKPQTWEMKEMRTTWLAYNRRADVILEPKGQESGEAYPNDVADARILWQQPRPHLKNVEQASASIAQTGSLQANTAGN